MRGRKALVEQGQVLRVGRSEPAALVLPHDAQLSGLHFELAWDGRTCRVADLGSAKGISVNGEPTVPRELFHGDWLRAGETDFVVSFERATARTGPAPLQDGEANEQPEEVAGRTVRVQALQALRAVQAPLFAVLDAARTDRVLALLAEAPEEHISLYEGAESEALAEVAPYLVALPRGSWLLEALVWEGWGEAWGVYLVTRQSARELRRHLRRFLLVEDEQTGRELYFRFYDPRALRGFLPTCTTWQLAELQADIEAFVMEGEAGEVLRFEGPSVRSPGWGAGAASP
jgi:pSer/pThr/pTyr-binding forkhead associated (FHA) protein